MNRLLAVAVVLVALGARAHTFAFDFVAPSGVGTKTDGGVTVIQWVDGPDPNDLAKLTLYASRNGVSPFEPAAQNVQFGPVGIPVSDPLNLAVWDATAVAPGCYQPFALMVDTIEGTTLRLSTGIIAVVPTDGGNVPPALWVLNQPTERPSDAGSFGVRIKVDDPDDTGTIAIRWSSGVDAGGLVVAGLPVPDGGGTLTYTIDLRQLPPAQTYFLQAEITAFDGQRCAVWWPGHLPGPLPDPDGGLDAGLDAGGPRDGGPGVPMPPHGCGCGVNAPPLGLLAVLVMGRIRRPARETPAG